MIKVVLNEKASEPDDVVLKDLLGDSYSLWSEINEVLARTYGGIKQAWKFYGKKNGWLLKNEYENRNLFFLVPGEGCFTLSYTFGEGAIKLMPELGVSPEVSQQVGASKKYPEGRLYNLAVVSRDCVETALMLVEAKLMGRRKLN